MKTKKSNADVPVSHIATIFFNQVDESSRFYFSADSDFAQNKVAAELVEEIATGDTFLIVPDDDRIHYMFGWGGEMSNPTNINLLPHGTVWDSVDINAKGPRVGGVKNFGLSQWPHFEGRPLNFAAQFIADDGKLIHVFVDDRKNSNAAENQANCALVEGSLAPSWIELKSVEISPYNLARNPLYAFTPRPIKSKMKQAPFWIQDDETPDGFDFVIQFGHSIINFMNLPHDHVNKNTIDQFSFKRKGDMYLFYRADTQEARVVWQSETNGWTKGSWK